MSPDQLQALLNRMGCVRQGNRIVAGCPCCDHPDDPEGYHLQVSPGGSYPIVAFCCKCMVPKPQSDAERRANRQRSRMIWEGLGADLNLIYSRMDAGEIRRLWSQIRIGGQGVEQEEPYRADDDVLHRTYSTLLDLLQLSDRHRKWLAKRGLDPDWCFEVGYRTAPKQEDRPAIQQVLRHLLTSECQYGVPGLCSFTASGCTLLTRPEALLLPCRDRTGRIGAIKQRITDGGRCRMRYLSGGGSKAKAMVHWPLHSDQAEADVLFITEGERKADAVYYHYRSAVIGLPGVGRWLEGVGLGLEVGRVVLAMDADPAGRRATDLLGRELSGRDVDVQVARWDGFKGIDDALAGGAKIEVEDWKEPEGEQQEQLIASPPTKSPHPHRRLQDHEVLPFIRANGPILRSRVNGYDLLISEYIRRGVLKMTKGPSGQILEVVDE